MPRLVGNGLVMLRQVARPVPVVPVSHMPHKSATYEIVVRNGQRPVVQKSDTFDGFSTNQGLRASSVPYPYGLNMDSIGHRNRSGNRIALQCLRVKGLPLLPPELAQALGSPSDLRQELTQLTATPSPM